VVDRSFFFKGGVGGRDTYTTLQDPYITGSDGMPFTDWVIPASMENIHTNSQITITNDVPPQTATVTGVGPNSIQLNGLNNIYGPGVEVSITRQVPVFDADGNPVVDEFGLPVTAPQTFRATLNPANGLIVPNAGAVDVPVANGGDLLAMIAPGDTISVGGQRHEETVTVTQVDPLTGQATRLKSNFRKVHNRGSSIRVHYTTPGRWTYCSMWTRRANRISEATIPTSTPGSRRWSSLPRPSRPGRSGRPDCPDEGTSG
jgi:hypothetical protein